MLQPTNNDTAPEIAIFRYLPERAVMTTRPSPMKVPGFLSYLTVGFRALPRNGGEPKAPKQYSTKAPKTHRTQLTGTSHTRFSRGNPHAAGRTADGPARSR